MSPGIAPTLKQSRSDAQISARLLAHCIAFSPDLSRSALPPNCTSQTPAFTSPPLCTRLPRPGLARCRRLPTRQRHSSLGETALPLAPMKCCTRSPAKIRRHRGNAAPTAVTPSANPEQNRKRVVASAVLLPVHAEVSTRMCISRRRLNPSAWYKAIAPVLWAKTCRNGISPLAKMPVAIRWLRAPA
jgi:hypothetical protein